MKRQKKLFICPVPCHQIPSYMTIMYIRHLAQPFLIRPHRHVTDSDMHPASASAEGTNLTCFWKLWCEKVVVRSEIPTCVRVHSFGGPPSIPSHPVPIIQFQPSTPSVPPHSLRRNSACVSRCKESFPRPTGACQIQTAVID